jgi:stage II sporulation protein D
VRGDLEIQPQRGRLQIVLTASLESAVASVVAAEMSAGSGVEAVKSLAIVVRTFMASHSGRHAAARFDFCDTTHCQLYRGEDDLADRSTRARVGAAVEATEGQYLSFRHRPIEGHYTAACGGLSATPDLVWGGSSASGYPYRPVACEWCRTSRYYRWERSAPAELVLDALSVGTGLGISPAAELSTRSYEPSGPVREVVIINRGHRVTISPDQFRRYVGRKLGWNTVLSPTFTIERRGPVFVFRGQGFGSQVGLCVAGAAAQASAGRTHKDILSFHFPDAEITSHIAQ